MMEMKKFSASNPVRLGNRIYRAWIKSGSVGKPNLPGFGCSVRLMRYKLLEMVLQIRRFAYYAI